MERTRAWPLLTEYTLGLCLLYHALAVEAAMRAYARSLGGDEDRWGATGFLHDFDYERWPDIPAHTQEGAKILREYDVDEEIIGAILSHAEWNQGEYPLDRPIRKALFAVDELCGFIVAVAYVRPEKLDGMTPKSVRKKMKAKGFAAAVKREDIVQGAELMEAELNDHIAEVITALQDVSSALGFN